MALAFLFISRIRASFRCLLLMLALHGLPATADSLFPLTGEFQLEGRIQAMTLEQIRALGKDYNFSRLVQNSLPGGAAALEGSYKTFHWNDVISKLDYASRKNIILAVDSAIAQNSVSKVPENLEKSLQSLTSEQMQHLMERSADLREIAQKGFPGGNSQILTGYKTYRWRDLISPYDKDSAKLNRMENDIATIRMDFPVGNPDEQRLMATYITGWIKAMKSDQVQNLICADPTLKAMVASLPSSFQDGLKVDHTVFGWEGYLTTVTATQFGNIANLSKRIRDGEHPVCIAVPPPAAKPNPALAGKLLREPKSGGTFVLDRTGLRRWIASVQVFADCGLDWGQVENQADTVINGISEGPKLETAEQCREVRPSNPNGSYAGKLMKIASDARVYLIGRDGYRYWVANPSVFTACGLDWGRIETLPPSQVFAIAAGNPPGLNDGRDCAAKR